MQIKWLPINIFYNLFIDLLQNKYYNLSDIIDDINKIIKINLK